MAKQQAQHGREQPTEANKHTYSHARIRFDERHVRAPHARRTRACVDLLPPKPERTRRAVRRIASLQPSPSRPLRKGRHVARCVAPRHTVAYGAGPSALHGPPCCLVSHGAMARPAAHWVIIRRVVQVRIAVGEVGVANADVTQFAEVFADASGKWPWLMERLQVGSSVHRCVCARARASVCVPLCVRACLCVCVCACVRMCVCVRGPLCLCARACVFVYAGVCNW